MVLFAFHYWESQVPVLHFISGRFSRVLLAALGLLLTYLGPPLTKVMQISGIPVPFLSLLRNCDSRAAGEHARLTCEQAGTQVGLSHKYTPWVINHKDYVSQIRYFLFWTPGLVSVSATLAKWRWMREIQVECSQYCQVLFHVLSNVCTGARMGWCSESSLTFRLCGCP